MRGGRSAPMSKRTEKILISISYFVLLYLFFLLLIQAKIINNQEISPAALLKSVLVLVLLLTTHLVGGLLGYRYFNIREEHTPNEKLTKLIFAFTGLHGLYFMVFGQVCEKIDQITDPDL
jgi:uncharacterized membrane protein YuzA (DUF378 family)